MFKVLPWPEHPHHTVTRVTLGGRAGLRKAVVLTVGVYYRGGTRAQVKGTSGQSPESRRSSQLPPLPRGCLVSQQQRVPRGRVLLSRGAPLSLCPGFLLGVGRAGVEHPHAGLSYSAPPDISLVQAQGPTFHWWHRLWCGPGPGCAQRHRLRQGVPWAGGFPPGSRPRAGAPFGRCKVS